MPAEPGSRRRRESEGSLEALNPQHHERHWRRPRRGRHSGPAAAPPLNITGVDRDVQTNDDAGSPRDATLMFQVKAVIAEQVRLSWPASGNAPVLTTKI